MTGKPAFLMRFGPEADAFDTLQRSGDFGAITDGHSTALADWKGERSRRVPGDGEPNGVRRTSEDDRRESSGKSTGVTVGNEERSEPRAHESARASRTSVPSRSTSETAQPPIFQLTSYQ